MKHLLQRANAPFSIIFSNTYLKYYKGIKKRYYGVKGQYEFGTEQKVGLITALGDKEI